MNADTILAARQIAVETFDTRNLKSKLWQLTEEHFVQVVTWLDQRLGYVVTEELCVTELKLPSAKAPDKNSLWRFWEHSGFRQLLQREHRKWCASQANQAAADAASSPADWARANADKIQQVTYELLNGGADIETVKPFVQASLKLKQMEIEREKLQAAMRTKAEAGFAEIAKELEGDAEALELLGKIQERVAAKMREAA